MELDDDVDEGEKENESGARYDGRKSMERNSNAKKRLFNEMNTPGSMSNEANYDSGTLFFIYSFFFIYSLCAHD